MDHLGLLSALAAMRPDDGQRYASTPMFSALPDAPTVPERRAVLRALRSALRRWFTSQVESPTTQRTDEPRRNERRPYEVSTNEPCGARPAGAVHG